MNASTTKSLCISCVLHGAIVAAIIAMGSMVVPVKKPAASATDQVITIHQGTSLVASSSSGAPSSHVKFTPPPRPVVRPETQAHDEPEAEQVSPSSPVSTPTPVRPKPITPTPPKRITHADYIRLHGHPKPPAGAAGATPPKSPGPRIAVEQLTPTGNRLGVSQSSGNSSGPDTHRFVGPLLAQLKNALDSNPHAHPGTTVDVEFTLGSDGKLVDCAITRSSGAPDFDAAVLQTLSNTHARDFTREELGKRYSLTFVVS